MSLNAFFAGLPISRVVGGDIEDTLVLSLYNLGEWKFLKDSLGLTSWSRTYLSGYLNFWNCPHWPSDTCREVKQDAVDGGGGDRAEADEDDDEGDVGYEGAFMYRPNFSFIS